jgi:phosphate transport system substrate-binding protein
MMPVQNLSTLRLLCFCLLAASAAILNGCVGPSKKDVLLTGAGASFPYPIYSKWFYAYRQQHPHAWINYQSIGSGGGIRQLRAGTVDFGATDIPLTQEQTSRFPVPVEQFPSVVGAVVASYNLPGVSSELRFTSGILAGIYLGRVTRWNDPQLVIANPEVQLPAAEIIVVHRSDGSGTTYVWTDYLSIVSSEWKRQVGTGAAVQWPVGLGAKGNEGVAGLIKQTPYSLGYLEFVYARQSMLPYASIRNAAGSFVRPGSESISAAAAAKIVAGNVSVSIVNAPGAAAYPVCSFTWLLIPSRIEEVSKRMVLTDFLEWMLVDGQRVAESLGYGRVPIQIVETELLRIRRIR